MTNQCDTCAHNEYDDEYDCWVCQMDMDEDELYRLMNHPRSSCPYYRNGDEYAVVRHQM